MNGELVLHHFGGPIHVSFAPEHRLGLVLLSAGPDSTGFVHQLAASLYDLLLDKPNARETLAESLKAAREQIAERLDSRRQREAALSTRMGELARPAEAYAGTYVSDRLGEMTVSRRADGSGLGLDYGVLSLDLVPLEPDVFLVRFPDLGPVEIGFASWVDDRPGTLDWGGRLFDRE